MRAHHPPRLAVGELVLAAVTVSVAAGFARLFTDGGWMVPLVLIALVTHAVGAALRRLGLGPWFQLAAVGVTTMLVMSWTQAPDTLRWFLPTGDTLAAFGTALDEALVLYPEARAPTEPVMGFVLAAMFGIAVVATMADIAAFRLGSDIQALIPPLTLFVFCSLLGSGEHQVLAAVAFGGLSLLFMLVMRTMGHGRSSTWLPGDDRRGTTAMLRVGGSLTAVAALAAAVVAPSLPGADEEALWTWRGGGGGGLRYVINPLVDIRSRLVNQSSDIAFVVESAEPSYWRMMALEDFDGDQFTLSATFRSVGSTVDPTGTLRGGELIEQQFTVEALASPYLPAAFRPIRVEVPDQTVRWDDRSATLLLDTSVTPRGLEYTVESVLPDLDPEVLRAAPDTVLATIADRYLTGPELPPRVVELAESITAGLATPYDRALALQDHLRSQYRYSLEVPDGHSDSAIERFLFEDRAGYCEQFSVAFAAMARQVGIPSRVAVGFTVGEQSREDPTIFTVRGEHAHAWPEVWFSGIGWVPFEPTPGRGDPQSSEHTGVDPDQQGGLGPATTTTTSSTTPGDRPVPDFDPSMLPDFDVPQGGSGTTASDGGGIPRVGLVAGSALAAVGAWVGLVAAALALRRWHRRRRAGDEPAARVLAAWDDVLDAARSLRLVPEPTDTYREYARRLAEVVPDAGSPVRRLAETTARARFAPSIDPLDADRAVADSAEVVPALLARRERRQQLIDLVDLRRALPNRRPTRRRRAATVTGSTLIDPAGA